MISNVPPLLNEEENNENSNIEFIPPTQTAIPFITLSNNKFIISEEAHQ